MASLKREAQCGGQAAVNTPHRTDGESVETSAHSVPAQLEPDEARLFAAALDEAARLVDRARAATR